MPRLVVEKGIDKGKSVEVAPRGTVVIGRDASAALRLGDMMASRLHFRIEQREDGLWLFDLKSMNGTYVNGERVQEARLKPGDRIQVGETLLTYVSDEDAEEVDTLIGTVISGYKVLERVGRGGMGTVYKAEQLSLKRIVALKVISSEHTKDKTFVELFLREARAAAQLNHPNIVQVYDAKGAEGTYFYSMEFVPHGSVQDLLSAEKKLTPERAAKMALQAARGLEYAERKEIVHRDIKPDNLMIGELEEIKIADLGLAQSAKEASKIEETRTVLGTPHYIAPEQVLGRPADHRSDIYSLGATLYRMLAGTTPYTGSNVMEIVQRKVREDPMPLNDLDPGVPKRLSELTQKMMARKPEERFQKVSEVVEALEQFLHAPPATTISAGPRRGSRPPIALWVGGGAAAAAILIALIALFTGGDEAPKPPPPPDPVLPAPPVVVNPGSPDAEEELAQVYFQQALDFEAKQLKKDRESSIEEAIARYQKVVDKCPRSSKVDDAQARIAALRGLLGRAAALGDLRAAERADAESFDGLLKRSQDDLPDPALLRALASESTARYAKVEQNHPRTEAAQRARQIQEHIAAWLAGQEAAAKRYAETLTAARQDAAAGRFGAAIDRWTAFLKDQQAAALKSPFPDGRYGDLLAAPLAARRIEEIRADALNAFQEARQEANALVAASRFDDAKARYQQVIDTCGIPEVADLARGEIGAIDKKIIAKLDAERKAQEEQERLRIQQDDALLAQAAAAVLPLVKQYDFAKAVEAYRKATGALSTDRNRAAAARRLADLECLARLKDGLIRRVNASEQTRDFVRHIRTKTQSGEISGATEDRLLIQVAVGDSGGTAELPAKWTEFTPKEYCALFRGRWSLSAADLIDLGCTYREFGFLEEAEEAYRQAQAKATDDATREAAAKRLAELAPGADMGPGATRETEAERRLSRARALAEQRRYADAKLELEAILKTLADTEAIKKARAEVDALLKDVTARIKSEEDKTRRTQRLQRYKEVTAQELRESQSRRREVAARLPLIADELEKRYQTLLVAMAWQDWVQATTIGEGLRAALEPQIPALAANGDLDLAAAAYAELLRLDTINGDKIRFDRHAKEAATYFASHTPWVGRTAPALAAWRDKTFPEGVAEMKKIKAEIESDPAPDLLWRLARILRSDVPLRLEERQTLRALSEIQPDHKEVSSGEVLYRLAENAIAFREIPHAQSLIDKLKADYPECPRLKPNATTGLSPVDYLLRDCARLGQLLGFIKKAQ